MSVPDKKRNNKWIIMALTGALVSLIGTVHLIQDNRLDQVEAKIKQVKVPNVGMQLCDTKCTAINKKIDQIDNRIRGIEEKQITQGETLVRIEISLDNFIQDYRRWLNDDKR